MNKGLAKLKEAWEENPLQVLFVAGLLTQGAAKLMKVNVERQNAKTYRMETQRRMMLQK